MKKKKTKAHVFIKPIFYFYRSVQNQKHSSSKNTYVPFTTQNLKENEGRHWVYGLNPPGRQITSIKTNCFISRWRERVRSKGVVRNCLVANTLFHATAKQLFFFFPPPLLVIYSQSIMIDKTLHSFCLPTDNSY